MRYLTRYLGLIIPLFVVCSAANAQMQPGNPYYGADSGYWMESPPGPAPWGPPEGPQPARYGSPAARTPHPQYDSPDGEAILREQMMRSRAQRNPRAQVQPLPQVQPPPQVQPQVGPPQNQHPIYDNTIYGHRPATEEEVRAVMEEARYIGTLVRKRNGKPFVVIDKRNFQFYLYDAYGRLLRIGPVAVGKGDTEVGRFETPVGVYPIRSKVEKDDWIRPDWYFVEEGEPIPQRYEDRRVPGFFRYKLVFDGTRYIHYAEATGGRLTHGCLGLDWQDAEAVYHTLDVGSYAIIVDEGFLERLARGEFPIKTVAAKPPAKPKNEGGNAVTAKVDSKGDQPNPVFTNMW